LPPAERAKSYAENIEIHVYLALPTDAISSQPTEGHARRLAEYFVVAAAGTQIVGGSRY